MSPDKMNEKNGDAEVSLSVLHDCLLYDTWIRNLQTPVDGYTFPGQYGTNVDIESMQVFVQDMRAER